MAANPDEHTVKLRGELQLAEALLVATGNAEYAPYAKAVFKTLRLSAGRVVTMRELANILRQSIMAGFPNLPYEQAVAKDFVLPWMEALISYHSAREAMTRFIELENR